MAITITVLVLIALIIPGILIIYVLCSWIRYRLYPHHVKKDENFLPPVSIIIACYNDGAHIKNKILSFLEPDEWIAGSEMIIVSAGSTDTTNEVLKEFESHSCIKILYCKEKTPKIKAVNMAVKHAVNQILVFSDCRQKMKKGSVRKMIHNFADINVGTVVSVLLDKGEKASFFRKWINRIVYFDSISCSGLNVHGALYAQRKELFIEFPQHLLFDDLYVIVSTLKQNKRLIVEPDATIFDLEFGSYYVKERLHRLTRGLLLFLVYERKLIASLKAGDFVRFIVFKYVKLLLPMSLISGITAILLMIINYSDYLLYLILASGIITIAAVPVIRRFSLLFLRIIINFLEATILFFFFGKKSNEWKKLESVIKKDEKNGAL